MRNFVIRRLFWAVFLFFTATLVTYLIFFVIPSDPAKLIAGRNADAADVARVARVYHLNIPVWQQYWIWLWNIVRHGSLGNSYISRTPVRYLIGQDAPVTASLVFGGAIFWLSLSIPIGILSALRPKSLMDRASMVFVLVGISAHPVWLGLILSYLVGYRLHITPIAGYCNFFPGDAASQCNGPIEWAYHLILPWITFMVLFAALYVRLIRANVLETMSEDYVRTARAKGAGERRVLIHHVLRNSMLPVVTILGMDIGLSLGGAIFTESIFELPGLGRQLISAYSVFDLPIIAGVITFATFAVIVFNFLVDVAYGFVDPRIRVGYMSGSPVDFWLGTWEVRDSHSGELAGHNVISEELDGNAVLERWEGAGGLCGMSLFYRDGGAWFQTWATSIGRAKRKAQVAVAEPSVRFEGVVDGGRDRTTLTPLPDGTVRQVIEVASLGRDDWHVGFDAVYTRQ